jgi:hypothetical protein
MSGVQTTNELRKDPQPPSSEPDPEHDRISLRIEVLKQRLLIIAQSRNGRAASHRPVTVAFKSRRVGPPAS